MREQKQDTMTRPKRHIQEANACKCMQMHANAAHCVYQFHRTWRNDIGETFFVLCFSVLMEFDSLEADPYCADAPNLTIPVQINKKC